MRLFKKDTIYDKKALIKSVVGMLLIMLFLKATGGAGFVAVLFLILAAVVMNKPTKLLYYFLVSVLMTMCNSFLVPKGGGYAITLRIINLTLGSFMLVKLAGMKASPLAKPFLGMFSYLFYMAIVSQSGWCPTISNMKLILFFFIYAGYYGVANCAINAGFSEESKVKGIILAFTAMFIIGSTLVIPFPAISIMNIYDLPVNEMPVSLFQGITNHSQCLGPAIAILTTMLYADLLFNIRKVDKLYIVMLICAPILLYKTSSRTAMGSCLAGMAIVTYYFLKLRGVNIRWRGKVMGAVWAVIVAAAIATLAIPRVREGARHFVLKFDRGDTRKEITFENVTMTRAGKWEETMANFRRSPAVGNGFQVAEKMSGITARDAFKHLSAPIEKGVWVSAILEEGGIFGMIIFLIFLATVFFSLSRQKAYTGLATFMVLVISNLGEFTIFSMTYTGGLQWAVVFVSLVLDAQRLNAAKRERQMPFQNLPERRW